MTKWLRNEAQRKRYDVKSNKTLERMRADGRLPKSKYPWRNKIPANTEEELDAWDRAAVVAGPKPRPVLQPRSKRRGPTKAAEASASSGT